MLWLIHRNKLHWTCDLSLSVSEKKYDTRADLIFISNRDSGSGMVFVISMGLFAPSAVSFTAFSLLNVQDSVADGAGVVGVLEPFHEEWDQAAAQD